MSDRRNAFRVRHSRACLAREESRNSEGKLLWRITTTGEGRPAGEMARTRDSVHPAAVPRRVHTAHDSAGRGMRFASSGWPGRQLR
jgi:hypothetical protein